MPEQQKENNKPDLSRFLTVATSRTRSSGHKPGIAWHDEYYEYEEEPPNDLLVRLDLKRIVIYCLCILIALSLLITIYFLIRPDPYLSKLRTQYSDTLISHTDKAKIAPLEYNVGRLTLEEALDVFINPAVTTEERKRIAQIILDKESGFGMEVNRDIISKSRVQRVYEKFEKAIAMGIREMAKR